MAIFDFFRRKPNRAGSPLAAFGIKITKQLAELNNIVRKIEKTQRETVLQLEEIDAAINVGADKTIISIIDIADIIYDFYYFARNDDMLKSHAQMMWNNAKKSLLRAGIDILEPTGEQFNHNLHEVHDTIADSNIPHGSITATLKCGYIHEPTILRRATVVVNKHTQEEQNG